MVFNFCDTINLYYLAIVENSCAHLAMGHFRWQKILQCDSTLLGLRTTSTHTHAHTHTHTHTNIHIQSTHVLTNKQSNTHAHTRTHTHTHTNTRTHTHAHKHTRAAYLLLLLLLCAAHLCDGGPCHGCPPLQCLLQAQSSSPRTPALRSHLQAPI